jgi:hypothetical protein
MMRTPEQLIADYLHRLDRELADLPRARGARWSRRSQSTSRRPAPKASTGR